MVLCESAGETVSGHTTNPQGSLVWPAISRCFVSRNIGVCSVTELSEAYSISFRLLFMVERFSLLHDDKRGGLVSAPADTKETCSARLKAAVPVEITAAGWSRGWSSLLGRADDYIYRECWLQPRKRALTWAPRRMDFSTTWPRPTGGNSFFSYVGVILCIGRLQSLSDMMWFLKL